MGNAQMLVRCPHSRRLGSALLHGWRWIIASDGYANVVPSVADAVEGILYELDAADEAALDRHEEVDAGCYDKRYLPVLHAGQNVLSLVYVSPLTDEGVATADYAIRLQKGFADAGLTAGYLARTVRRFIDVPLPGN